MLVKHSEEEPQRAATNFTSALGPGCNQCVSTAVGGALSQLDSWMVARSFWSCFDNAFALTRPITFRMLRGQGGFYARAESEFRNLAVTAAEFEHWRNWIQALARAIR